MFQCALCGGAIHDPQKTIQRGNLVYNYHHACYSLGLLVQAKLTEQGNYHERNRLVVEEYHN